MAVSQEEKWLVPHGSKSDLPLVLIGIHFMSHFSLERFPLRNVATTVAINGRLLNPSSTLMITNGNKPLQGAISIQARS